MPGRPRRQHTSSSSRSGGQGPPRRGPAARQYGSAATRGSAAPRGSAARTRPPARRPDPYAGLDQALAAAAAVPQPDAATFGALGVDDRLVGALAAGGIRQPFAIQPPGPPPPLPGPTL